MLYTRTSERKLPSAKKASKLTGDDITRNPSYYKLNETTETIEKENLVKAFAYGKTLIPFSSVDEEQISLKTEKSLQIIGFVPSHSIDRACFMSNSTTVLSTSESQIALSAFIHAMYEKNCYALGRYCRTDNSNPKLVVLIPHIKSNYECLYMNVFL
jgi:ATP-dependent DNA helicase 2 subunit 2